MSSYDLAEHHTINLNAKTGITDAMLRKHEENRQLLGWVIFDSVTFILGVIFILVGCLAPQEDPFEGPFFIGFVVAGSSLAGLGLVFGMILPCQWQSNKVVKRSIESWAASPTSLEWSKQEYSGADWQRYYIEEFGSTGRSTIKYTWQTYLGWVGYWIVYFAFSCIVIAIKLIDVEISESTIFGLSFSVFIVYLALVLATLATIAHIVTPVIKYHVFKNKCVEPMDFRGTVDAIYWVDAFLCWNPPETSCFGLKFDLLGIRVNTYQNLMHPCLEFVVCAATGKYKTPAFHRVPIPLTRLQDVDGYVKSVSFSVATLDPEIWKKLEGYAKDLEDGAVQLTETCF